MLNEQQNKRVEVVDMAKPGEEAEVEGAGGRVRDRDLAQWLENKLGGGGGAVEEQRGCGAPHRRHP